MLQVYYPATPANGTINLNLARGPFYFDGALVGWTTPNPTAIGPILLGSGNPHIGAEWSSSLYH